MNDHSNDSRGGGHSFHGNGGRGPGASRNATGGSSSKRFERGGGRGRPGGDSSRRGGPRGESQNRRHSGGQLAPAQRAKQADAARQVAWDTLQAVAEADAYANLVLPQLLTERRLSRRDAAFATELTYGTLRHQGTYDAIITSVSSRDFERIDPALVNALRMGAHQLFAMRVPDHAAVSATVALVRSRIGAGAAQFANAALRAMSKQDFPTWLEAITEGLPETEALAVRTSHPGWIVRAFRSALGRRSGELKAALAADNEAAKVTLVARPGLATIDELSDSEAGSWVETAAVLQSGDPHRLTAVREGRAGVQDEGSQLVTLVAAAAPIEGRDENWLDLCAGPGGKAALFASLLAGRNPSGTFIANEVAPHRARLVEDSTKAVRQILPGLTVRCGDGRTIATDYPDAFDRAIVDVPCTGLGALRRRPEARWRKTPATLAELGPLQRELLQAALASVRVGGVVTYITCSPHIGETRLVVEDVLKKSGLGELLDATAIAAQTTKQPLPAQDGPYIQLWPHAHQTDAMFCAVIRRVAAQ